MADYELNDHDRAELVKVFFKRFGYWIILAIIIFALGLGLSAYWQSHNATRAQAASNAYQALITSIQNGAKPNVVQAAATQISQDYSNTIYATLAQLNLAQLAVSQNNLDGAADFLQKALKENNSNQLAPIIRLRLARILLAQNNPKQVLAILKHPPQGYEAAYGMLIGDANVQLNNIAAAKKAYQAALSKVNNPLLNQLLTARLNNLSVLKVS